MAKGESKNSGFTLIELIFVLAIIGVTITLGLSYTVKLAERTKEKTASLQIQQILQAALTYYVEKEKWPSKGDTSNINNAGDFQKYIPAFDKLAANPWGNNNYSWQLYGTMFGVSTIAPNTDTAIRIASLLPNASNSVTVVTSKIAAPDQAQKFLNGYLIATGEFEEAVNLTDSNCQKDNGCTTDGHKGVIFSQDAKIISCINKGGSIKIQSNITQFQLHGFVLGGMKFGDHFVVTTSEDLLCGNDKSKANQYCVYYHIQGDEIEQKHYIYPSHVVISYMVLCIFPVT